MTADHKILVSIALLKRLAAHPCADCWDGLTHRSQVGPSGHACTCELASALRGVEDAERIEAETVPRGHCGRCDRCGWPFAETYREGCVPLSCSQREGQWQRAPVLRTHCAGCGHRYADQIQERTSSPSNVVKICPCRTLVDEPAPHIQECPYSDPEYERAPFETRIKP